MRRLFLILMLFLAFNAHAETAGELRDKIADTGKEIDKLEAEITKYRQEINKLGKEANTLKTSIKELELNDKKLTTQVKSTETQITKSKLNIAELELGILDKHTRIKKNNESLASTLRALAETTQKTRWEILLSENTFSQVWRDIDNLQNLEKQTAILISDLKEIKADLENTKLEEEKEKAKLEGLKNRLVGEKKAVLANKNEKESLLKVTKNKESNYNKLLQEKLTKKAIFEKEMEEYESKLKFILDPSKLPSKGVLSWPLDNIYITQRFGKTSASGRLYASGTHNGADFRASVGTPVQAMGSGVVAGTGDTDRTCPYASFGKWVLIKYDNGLASTYGHLSVISSSVGERVNSSDIVAYSGNSGHSTAPHLHVTVYAKDAVNVATRPSKACPGKSYTVPVAALNAYLDPLYYLPPATAGMYKPGA
ncbi:MAG TPA: peptidoglycan DD-metalloendopeptidase family protein [Candidatus Paceibacterota bacterium]|nr:peptidoglycan DD-metalloendopeptidase family protein [Candidatus Paceibacterota bacterium]